MATASPRGSPQPPAGPRPGSGGLRPHRQFARDQPDDGKLPPQLLAGPEGARPGRPLLQPHRRPQAARDPLEEGAGEGRGANARRFGGRAIPGYTGFIPRAQNHFAKTYSQICKEAGQEFARQLARGAGGRRARQVVLTPQDVKPDFGLPAPEEKPPLAASPKASAPKPQGEPPATENGDPPRYFISGFKGFVPRARYLIGASYPALTQRAWAEFRQMLRKQRQETPRESDTHRKSDGQGFPPLVQTYPPDKGLLPHYQGYVPGYKFRFGHTYGHLTYDALGRSTLETLTPGRLP